MLSYMILTLPFTVWVLTTFMRELPQGARGGGHRRRRHALGDHLRACSCR